MNEIPDLRLPGWINRVDHGAGVHTLHYGDDASIRVEHLCAHPRAGTTLLIAPLLTSVNQPGGHQVTSRDPLTITPSILCGDCGLHGYVTNGEWRAC